MNKARVLLVAAGLIAAASFKPAQAEIYDVATLKCSDLTSMTADQIGVLLAWMDGYIGGRAEDTRIDFDRIQSNADAADKACAADANASVLSALKDAENAQ